MKHKTLIILFLFILNSCSSLDSNRIAPGYFQAYTAIKNTILGHENNIDSETIMKIPYASMIVQIGKGPLGLMILESETNGQFTWVSADGVYLVIKDGKIIKSHGLLNNLKESLNSSSGWSLKNIEKDYISYYSFDKPELNNLKVNSELSYIHKVEVDLNLRKLNLSLIHERIYSADIGWDRVNKYWLDDSNYVWKSVQNISPKIPPISFTVTKKPR